MADLCSNCPSLLGAHDIYQRRTAEFSYSTELSRVSLKNMNFLFQSISIFTVDNEIAIKKFLADYGLTWIGDESAEDNSSSCGEEMKIQEEN